MVSSNDLSLVIGIILTVLSIPSLLNAWSEDRPPRLGAILGFTGLVLIAIALANNPSGYTGADVPAAFRRVWRAYFG